MKKYLFLYVFILILLTGCEFGPDIQISGVEEGKVYTGKREITINKEQVGIYLMKLNGKPIESGHVIDKNGTYNLSIVAKKLWIEREREIEFKIDDQPPKFPTFKNEIKSGYFQEVKLQLNHEDGVTYTVKLNGKPFDLNNPIQEKGIHTLDILAKKENGKIAHRSDTFYVDKQTFKKEMVNTFLAFHFNGVAPEEQFILKWIGEKVPIYVHGKPTNADLKQLSKYLTEINNLVPVQFEIYQEKEINFTDYQLDIYFVPNEQFKNYGFSDEVIRGNVETVGFAQQTEANSVDGLLTSTIGIDSTISQGERNSTILHELIHALGMYNHFEHDTSSILYPINNQKRTTLNETDRKMVDMRYRADVLPAMNKEDILKLWSTRIEE